MEQFIRVFFQGLSKYVSQKFNSSKRTREEAASPERGDDEDDDEESSQPSQKERKVEGIDVGISMKKEPRSNGDCVHQVGPDPALLHADQHALQEDKATSSRGDDPGGAIAGEISFPHETSSNSFQKSKSNSTSPKVNQSTWSDIHQISSKIKSRESPSKWKSPRQFHHNFGESPKSPKVTISIHHKSSQLTKNSAGAPHNGPGNI